MRSLRWLMVLTAACTSPERAAVHPVRSLPPASQTRPPAAPVRIAETHPERAKKLLAAIREEKFDQAHDLLGDELKAKLPKEKIADAWHAVLEEYGKFLELGEIEAKPRGKLDRVRITCEFSHKRGVVEVVFDESHAITGLWFRHFYPPWSAANYADPERFNERPLAIGAAPQLPALLSIPNAPGSFPAVVLVHGSGPQDADESVSDEKYANRPFKDLAWGLASRGVAVIRYEKRTRAAPGSLPAALTLDDEVTNDACAALDALRAAPEVDAKRLVVVGHSLGARLAPRIATRCPPVAGVVLLAAPATPIDEALKRQYRFLMRAAGASTQAIDAQIQTLAAAFARVAAAGALEEQIVVGESSAPRSYWRDLEQYDTLAELGKFSGAVLALQGSRDYQVDPSADFGPIERALKQRKNATTKLYPDLNHHFIAGEGPPSVAEYDVPAHVSRAVLRDIENFVTKSKRP